MPSALPCNGFRNTHRLFHEREVSDAPLRQVVAVNDLNLADSLRKIFAVIGETAIGFRCYSYREVRCICGTQSIGDCQCERQARRGLIDRLSIDPTQETQQCTGLG